MVGARPGASFTSSLGILAVVGMGAYLLETDPNFTTGQFFAFLLYANMFYEPVRQLVSINNLVSAGKASGERVFEILDAEVRIKDPGQARSFPSSDHTIDFQSVSFSYDTRASIVTNLDFRLEHCSTTALVGPTGAGKSTIANLILRYYDVKQGSVRIGGEDVRELRLNDLRSPNRHGFTGSISLMRPLRKTYCLPNLRPLKRIWKMPSR